jgi:hypothetical protein
MSNLGNKIGFSLRGNIFIRKISGVILLITLFLFIGCFSKKGDERTKTAHTVDSSFVSKDYGNVVFLNDNAKNIHFDAYLTWKDFDGYCDRGNTKFIWNGSDVGQADEGLSRLISEFEKLPNGSMILVYPSYYIDYRDYYTTSGSGPRQYPFSNTVKIYGIDFGVLEDIIKKKNLVLLFSPRDHNGGLLSESKVPYGSKKSDVAMHEDTAELYYKLFEKMLEDFPTDFTIFVAYESPEGVGMYTDVSDDLYKRLMKKHPNVKQFSKRQMEQYSSVENVETERQSCILSVTLCKWISGNCVEVEYGYYIDPLGVDMNKAIATYNNGRWVIEEIPFLINITSSKESYTQ